MLSLGERVGQSGWFAILIASIFIIAYYLQSLIFQVRVMRTSTTIFTKESGCTILANLPVFEIVFAASIVFYHQLLCCIILHHNASVVTCVVSMKYS